eukprot:COSAG01_NODE_2392_length_7773_cov_9.347928_4_plen_61_part_00
MYYRHRDGRNILMPLFTSVSPVRAASLPEPLTATWAATVAIAEPSLMTKELMTKELSRVD